MTTLKTTNIEFNVPTLHSARANKEFKSCFRHIIKLLNAEVKASKEFETSWRLHFYNINSNNISIINFIEFCRHIVAFNYPRHKFKFELDYGFNRPSHVTVTLYNELKES